MARAAQNEQKRQKEKEREQPTTTTTENADDWNTVHKCTEARRAEKGRTCKDFASKWNKQINETRQLNKKKKP